MSAAFPARLSLECFPEPAVVRLALVTTTHSSSECRPDGEAEATSQAVALCGAKQGPQGFMAEPQNPATTRAHRCGFTSAKICPDVDLSRVPAKKSGAVPVLTYLPWLAIFRARMRADSSEFRAALSPKYAIPRGDYR